MIVLSPLNILSLICEGVNYLIAFIMLSGTMEVTLGPGSLVHCLVLLIRDGAKNTLLLTSWLVCKGGLKPSWLASLASYASSC